MRSLSWAWLPALGFVALLIAAPACGARTGMPVEAVAADGANGGGGGDGRIRADKIDLLFMIDNSSSMADKQTILASAVPDLVSRLVNPRCVDAHGAPAPAAPPGSTAPCPTGFHREFNPVQDIHIGVISSSLGAHGGDYCDEGWNPEAYDPTMNDRAHLLDRGPRGAAVATYQGLGFLAWDPGGTKKPPGEASSNNLVGQLKDLVVGTGQTGCGSESSLEAWYRFLIAPDPYETVVRVDCQPGSGDRGCAEQQGLDVALLQQRSDFLRPDTMVVIVMLTDEDDCSIIDGGQGFRVNQYRAEDGSDTFTMARATAACAVDVDDPCCRSCAAPKKSGCLDPALDPECVKGPYAWSEDTVNLRCWHQKQRFGEDYLYPIERYVRGLTELTVPDRSGAPQPNPLFADLTGGHGKPRPPSLVFLAAIVGVPWQDIAADPYDPTDLVYKTASELADEGVWATILGDPEHHVPPADPLMIDSPDPRTGENPITGDPLAPPSSTSPTANPINGHEFAQEVAGELQYACIFGLPSPRDCNDVKAEEFCDCATTDVPPAKPICQDESGAYGTTQFRAKAYPGLRHLRVLRDFGDNAILGSICARNVTDPSRSDFGYRPAFGAVLARLREGLE